MDDTLQLKIIISSPKTSHWPHLLCLPVFLLFFEVLFLLTTDHFYVHQRLYLCVCVCVCVCVWEGGLVKLSLIFI